MFRKIESKRIPTRKIWDYTIDLKECYESPKQEKVFHAFKHLIQNLKAYNGVRI